jgi:hypothetical protein
MKINNWLFVGAGLVGVGLWAYNAFWQKFYFEVLGYKIGWSITEPLKIRLDIDIKFTNKTNIQILIDQLLGNIKYGSTTLATVEGTNIVLPGGIVDVKTITAKIDIAQLSGDVINRIKSGNFFDKLLFEGMLTRNGSVIEFSKPINFLER